MDNLFVSAALGFLVGVSLVITTSVARIQKLLIEIRDELKRNRVDST